MSKVCTLYLGAMCVVYVRGIIRASNNISLGLLCVTEGKFLDCGVYFQLYVAYMPGSPWQSKD